MTNNGYLLDTHIWLWFVAGHETLSPEIQKAINLAIDSGRLYLSSISFWEVSMLVLKKRIILNCPTLEWIQQAKAYCNILDLTPAIAVDSCTLPDDFHGDPADRIIVASARAENLALLTRDKAILRYGQTNYLQVSKG